MQFPWQKKIGIDLGTANTLVFVSGKGIVLNEPSVVAIARETNKILAIGSDAKEMLGKTPETVVVHRPLQDGVIADYRITEAMLRHFITKALGGSAWFKPEVLVSVPAGITSTERRAVIEATIRAGAKTAVIVKEPILAAIGAGIPINQARGFMVVDIGGGTTDVAVISLGGIVACTSVKCAGNKIDMAITEHIKRAHGVIVGEQTAEELKINLATALPFSNSKNEMRDVKGRDMVLGMPKTVRVFSNELARAIDAELKLIVKAIKEVLQQTPPELASDIIDHGIIMTGGTSQLRNLPQLIEEQTGVSVRLADDALFCVAKGSGIALDHLQTYNRSILAKK
ncbi:MAG TPA: rod shape-determining protein [Candidatus Paceibacterota bacterium]|nr:rod shape-determining protein [Candidatus Paceibacterota bacterium]